MSANATDTDRVVVPKLPVLTIWCEYFGVEPVPVKEVRSQAQRDAIEQLASLFEQGKLAEGNSIQHDVPAFIRAQIKEGE